MWPDEAKRGVGVDVPEVGLESGIIASDGIDLPRTGNCRIDRNGLSRRLCTPLKIVDREGRLRTDRHPRRRQPACM